MSGALPETARAHDREAVRRMLLLANLVAPEEDLDELASSLRRLSEAMRPLQATEPWPTEQAFDPRWR